jgi:Replication protein
MAKVLNDVHFQVDKRGESSAGVILDKLALVDHTPIQPLRARALAKFRSNQFIPALLDLKSELHKGYLNTWFCSDILLQTPEKITTKLCKRRWCVVCNRIRTAKLIHQYKDVLDAMQCRSFVTLTTNYTNACTDKRRLSSVVTMYGKAFTRVWRRLKRKHGKIVAIRKTEIAYSRGDGASRTGEYFHPHFHLIMPNDKGQANDLVNEWLKEFPKANVQAQNIRVADDGSQLELFKYFTKLYDGGGNEAPSRDVNPYGDVKLSYPAKAMDTIFQVMNGRKILQTYGGKILNDVVMDIDGEVEITPEDMDYIKPRHEIWQWYEPAITWTNAIGECIV